LPFRAGKQAQIQIRKITILDKPGSDETGIIAMER
jgi:hypothetical protein